MKDFRRGALLVVRVWAEAMRKYPLDVLRFVTGWTAELAFRLATLFFLVRALEGIQEIGSGKPTEQVLILIGLTAVSGVAGAIAARLIAHWRYALATKLSAYLLLQEPTRSRTETSPTSSDQPTGPAMSQLADLTRFQLECYSLPLRVLSACAYIVVLLRFYPAMLVAAATTLLLILPTWIRLVKSRRNMILAQRRIQQELAVMLKGSDSVDLPTAQSKLRSVFWPQEAESQNASLAILFQSLALAFMLLTLLIVPPDNLLTALAVSIFLFRLAASEIGQFLHETSSAARFAVSAHLSLLYDHADAITDEILE